MSDEAVHPAEEAVWSFAPDKDRVDKILYDGIVDEEEIRTQLPRATRGGTALAGLGDTEQFKELLNQQDDAEYLGTESSESDSQYNVGGMRGFGTNIDDFLRKFGTVVDTERANVLIQRSKSSKALLKRQNSDDEDDKADDRGPNLEFKFIEEKPKYDSLIVAQDLPDVDLVSDKANGIGKMTRSLI